MIESPFTNIESFDWKELHKQVGQVVVIEPSESDIHEGNFMSQVWFMTKGMKLYLLDEWDIRQTPPTEGSENG